MNAAFPPSYLHSHIVLPPSLMYGENALTIWCTIHGSPVPFKISVYHDADIDDLKKSMVKEEMAFAGVRPSSISLWKLNVPVAVNPIDTLAGRIREQGDVETIAKELTIPTEEVSTLFPQSQLQAFKNYIHILVQLPSNNSRSWLAAIYSKLWGKHERFGEIFRTATLTEGDFNELQDLLDERNHERMSDSYVVDDVLNLKSAFLRSKSTPIEAYFGNGLAPRLVPDASHPPSSYAVAVANDDDDDDAVDDDDNAIDDDDDAVDDDNMVIDSDNGHVVDSHMAHLSIEATAIFPHTIRYVDLTGINLKNDLRVPLLMLFRNEWGNMIDKFNNGRSGIRGSAVITGQPGIGKTCLLYSILILCMIRPQPIVFQDMSGKVFIIDHKGVRTPEDGPALSLNSEVLTLVDADVQCFIPDVNLLYNSKHRILLTSSPRSRKDRGWLKQTQNQNAVYGMEPWSREEFVVASLFLHKDDITLRRLQKASLICGNIPRPCFEAAQSPTNLCEAEDVIRSAIQQTEDLFKVVCNMENGDMNKLTHHAFQVRPKSPNNRLWDVCVAQPVSDWAFSEMLKVLHMQSMDEAYRFYRIIKQFPDSSSLCRNMFEAYLHPFLNSRTFTIKSLDDHAATLQIYFPNRKTNHLSFKEKDFSTRLASSVKSKTPCYFQPESRIFPSFDSFLYQSKIHHGFSPLIALQVTTASKHGINIKGLQKVQTSLNLQNDFLKHLRPTKNRKMIVLFVVPDDEEKTFRKQKIGGKKDKHWYTKTVQYILGLPENELFKYYAEMEAPKEM